MYEYDYPYSGCGVFGRIQLGAAPAALPRDLRGLLENRSEARKRAVALGVRRARPLAICALVLASCGWNLTHASATVFGSNPAQLHQQFGAALRDHLASLYRERGYAATYHALWGLSAFQFYEMCQLYAASPTGGSCSTLFIGVFGNNRNAFPALYRLQTVNGMFNQSIYVTSIPGGRRRVAKLTPPTIGGMPAQTTVSEYFAECVTATGDITQGTALAIKGLAGDGSIWFGAGYLMGTGFSWLIQTFDPSLQEAIGDNIGYLIDLEISSASALVAAELSIAQQYVSVIQTLGAPGLNESDFDGLQPSFFEMPQCGVDVTCE